MHRRTLLGAAALTPFAALAQGTDFPSRPITMVVPFPPGGQADLAARPTASCRIAAARRGPSAMASSRAARRMATRC
jgi:tripartite-type tricarboxylate transporter receptor subunit TctC